MPNLYKGPGLIGKNILLMPGNELIDILEDKDTWPTETCWFCEKRPAVRDAALTKPCSKEINREFHGDKWVVEEEILMVEVPRCVECKSVHRFRKIAPYIGFTVLIAVWFGAFSLMLHLGIDIAPLLVIIFLVFSLAVYGLASFWLLPKIIKPGSEETKEQDHWEWNFPGMAEVKNANYR